MGSIGGMELVLVLVVALLLFGPRKLPQIGRTIGKAMTELRKASRDFKMNLDREVGLEEVRSVRQDLTRAKKEVSSTIDELRDPLGAAGSSAASDAPASAPPAAPVPRADGPARDAGGPDDAPAAGDDPPTDAADPRKD
jgi:Tat protein translocase TatB subunit